MPRWNFESIEERFLSHVIVDPETGCWHWTGKKDRDGYGRFKLPGDISIAVHKWAYMHWRGSYTEPELDHLCRNTSCGSPWHVEPVTKSQNQKRGKWGVLRSGNGYGVCSQGHQLEGENLLMEAGGVRTPLRRRCRICRHSIKSSTRIQEILSSKMKDTA